MLNRDVPAAVMVEGLVKSYGGRRALDGISFSVHRGELFALLGPNGAGKTTTIEILEGYRRADAGRVSVLGLDPLRGGDALKSRMGAMLQDGGLYLTMTPLEALRLFARFYPRAHDPQGLIALVGLQEVRNTSYRRLSGGERQRLSLALALIGCPEIVFLDEPTAGLDPQARRTTWNVISTLRDEGLTVILSTHYLEEAEQLADRVAILHAGRLVALDSPSHLMQSDANSLRLRADRDVPLERLSSLPSALAVYCLGGPNYLLESRDSQTLLVELAVLLKEIGIGVVELRSGHESLEDVFMRLVGATVDT